MTKEHFFSEIKSSLFRGKFSQKQVDGLDTLIEATTGLEIRHRAYIIATAYHETAYTMQPIYERGGRKYFDKYDGRLGNSQKGDGYRYRGRGYVQLTGKGNYEKASDKLGADLVGEPDLALDPRMAARILVRGMTEGWFTTKKLSDFKSYSGMRRIVNGKDRASLIAGYADAFEVALGLIGSVSAAPDEPITTGKPISKSTTNIAAVTAGLSMAASASGDAHRLISNLGINPKWLLLVVGIAAVAWIFKERILKARNEGV